MHIISIVMRDLTMHHVHASLLPSGAESAKTRLYTVYYVGILPLFLWWKHDGKNDLKSFDTPT